MKLPTALLACAIGFTGLAYGEDFSPDDICKAAVSMEMGRPTEIMKAEKNAEYSQVSYLRDGHELFRYRCKLQGNRVLWSSFHMDTKDWGRWRDIPDVDAKTTYEIKASRLIITNDQVGTESFSAKSFNKKPGS